MSDPLSVAGTAVGITSLGIQVCQGLVWYLHSVHGRRAEITDDLNEVQALISIFYSLNDILPKLNQTRCTEVTTIRRCLEDSEGKLLELNQLLIKLSSPQQPTTSREKMREAGRTLVYPFRADTLKSLRQSMRELLNNLNLAIDTTSLQVQVTNHDKIDDISRAIQDLGIQSKDANVGVQDLNTKMNENRSQLRSLEYTITNFLTQISHRVSQVEVTVKDIENNLAGKLNNVEAKIASTCQAITEVLTEAKRPENSQSAEMSQLSKGIETSNIQHQGVSSSTGAPEQVARHGSTISSPSRRGPPVCICEQRIHRSCFSLAFWNFKFEFQQQTTAKHRHRCKIVGIDGETQRRIKAQFPLKVAWLSARMTLACLEYTSGVSNMTLSVSYKNTVPRRFSPILRELVATGHGIVASRSAEETIQLLEGTERAILSLYREREASPRDLDEDGRCHLRMFIDIFANLNYPWMYTLGWEGSECEQLQNRVWCDDSVLAMVLRILQVLDKVVQSNDINVDWYMSPFFRSNARERRGVGLTRRQGRELVSYLATTQHFDPKLLIDGCLQKDTVSSLYSVPDVMDVMNLPEMARAVASRSVIELNRCMNSHAATGKRVCEYKTLQLSASWPQGLRMLLATDGQNLLNDWDAYQSSFSPLGVAMMTNCAESIDILMEAGCRLSFCNIEWAAASSECVMIVARRLFERREKLIQLAEDHLEAFEDECASHISDDVARFLYYELTSAGFPVDPALEVENWYTTVYHYPGLPLDHLRIFFEQGFRNHHGHDDLGLTPAMLWRDSLFSFEKDSEVDVNGYLSTLCWLEEEGFLDELPEDPHNIGLNTMSTGSHYLAALSCLYSSGNEASVVLPELSQSLARDDCVCWCIPGEHGCSPLGSILKAYADSDLEEKPCFWHQDLVGVLFSLGYDDTAIMTYFVRFLTFEALEMTHTCCHLGVFDRTFMKLVTNDDGNPAYEELYSDDSMGDMALVILDRDSNTIQETRTSKVERDNADLLNSLMKDFDRKLQGTEPTLETLQNFLRGYWRQRMARVFIVDDNAVDEMKTCLSNVQTYVLPERAQCFLPPGLDLRLTRR